MGDSCLIIGDIGGTNARFAIANPAEPGFTNTRLYACKNFETADSAIRSYLEDISGPDPDAICLAVAGPVVEQSVRFTNNNWSISSKELGSDFGGAPVCLLNDFEAIAYSVPFLAPTDSELIGLPDGGIPDSESYMLGIIGPGTGLGCAALCVRDGLPIPIVGEGGHSGFAPESQVQMDVLAVLRERFDRVSDERLVSGPGLQNLYWALKKIHGEKPVSLSAEEIFKRCESKKSARAEEAVQLFFELLGQISGNVALTLNTFDGVYIAGGIAKRYPHLLADSRFRAGFENKGRYRSLMEQIPTRLITHSDPGLLGASYCAARLTTNDIDHSNER